MTRTQTAEPGLALTPKGKATRDKIIKAAADLILTGGVARTTLDDVGAAATVGKSQMYHYFRDKDDLVVAVIQYQSANVVGDEGHLPSHLDTWDAWDRWRDSIVGHQRDGGCLGGCPLGSLANELSDSNDAARGALNQTFARWERRFAAGVAAMQEAGLISAKAEPKALATAVLATLQGGLLLCQLRREVRPLEDALEAVIAYLRFHSEPATGR